LKTNKQVVARSEMEHITTDVMAGRHGLVLDASEKIGGNDFGPSPYELLAASLAACSSMTMKNYALHHHWPLEEVEVHISFSKDYFDDCNACNLETSRLNYIERIVKFKGDLSEDQKLKLVEIANECPVSRTLSHGVEIKNLL
jgi:putative redox protein